MSRELDRRDFRESKLTPTREQELRSVAAATSEDLPGEQHLEIRRFDATTANPSVVGLAAATAEEGDYVQRALAYVERIKPVLGLQQAQAEPRGAFAPDPQVQTTSSGAVAVHLQQVHLGIPVFEAAQTVRFSPDGALEESAGSSVTVSGGVGAATPRRSAAEAVLVAAQHVAVPDADEEEGTDPFGEPLPLPVVDVAGFEPQVLSSEPGEPSHPTVLARGPFEEDIPAHLTWFPMDELRLCWEVVLTMPEHHGQYRTVVDAEDGRILYCRQLIDSIAARGSVYTVDGASARSMVDFPRALGDYRVPIPPGMRGTFPAEDWVDADQTLGNSTSARRGDDGPRLQGAAHNGVVLFDPANATGTDQQVLNIFYYNCYMHDYFYMLLFREVDGNFQQTNYGLGGAAGDRVDARAHPGAVWGTANMATPADGTSPVMNMGLVTSTNRHTAFDSSVVFHEFMHGVTNRLVGGPGNVNALNSPQSRGMGEGWSDFVPCTINDATVVGAWVVDNPKGIRGFAYDRSYPDGFGSLGTGRYTGPHAIGELWCATLMEMSRYIGRTLSMRLVVDALKLAPANPGFLNMRDSILTALRHMRTGGIIQPARQEAALRGVWAAFARYGMGAAAASNGAQLTGIVDDSTRPPVGEPQPEVAGRPVALVRGNASTPSAADLRINLFTRGADGKLWERYWGGTSWSWVDTGRSVFASPVVVARRGLGAADPGNLRIHVFVQGADGKLWERYWGGSGWGWSDTGKAVDGQPVVVLRGDVDNTDAATLRVNLFVRGADGKLWERYWGGSSWSWVDTGRSVAGDPIALARGELGHPSGDIRINLFVRGADGKLWERYWGGSSWSWSDTGRAVAGQPVAILRGDIGTTSGDVRINLFVRGADGKLWERYWNGASWAWFDHGKEVAGDPTVVVRGNTASTSGADVRIHVFVQGADGKLWERYWNGASWSWSDTGRAVSGTPIALLRGDTAAVSPADVRIHVFVRGADGKLWERYWSGGSWSWSDTGRAVSGTPIALLRGDTTAVSPVQVRIHVFTEGADGKLWERYWNGASWSWSDTGKLAKV